MELCLHGGADGVSRWELVEACDEHLDASALGHGRRRLRFGLRGCGQFRVGVARRAERLPELLVVDLLLFACEGGRFLVVGPVALAAAAWCGLEARARYALGAVVHQVQVALEPFVPIFDDNNLVCRYVRPGRDPMEVGNVLLLLFLDTLARFLQLFENVS